MIAVHGGEIFVESELGAGTTFRFFLPRRARGRGHVVETKGVSPKRIPNRSHYTVLLVDDDAMCRKAYARGLKQAGFDVLEADLAARKRRRALGPPPRP